MCYAHGIQLAMLEVLYKNNYNYCMDSDDAGENQHSVVTDRHLQACVSDSEAEVDEKQNNMEGEDEYKGPEGELNIDLYLQLEEIQDNLDSENDMLPELWDDYKDVIAKVRNMVKLFQKYILQEHDKDLTFMLDCPTHWNSFLEMLCWFQKLSSCVQKALIDIGLYKEVT